VFIDAFLDPTAPWCSGVKVPRNNFKTTTTYSCTAYFEIAADSGGNVSFAFMGLPCQTILKLAGNYGANPFSFYTNNGKVGHLVNISELDLMFDSWRPVVDGFSLVTICSATDCKGSLFITQAPLPDTIPGPHQLENKAIDLGSELALFSGIEEDSNHMVPVSILQLPSDKFSNSEIIGRRITCANKITSEQIFEFHNSNNTTYASGFTLAQSVLVANASNTVDENTADLLTNTQFSGKTVTLLRATGCEPDTPMYGVTISIHLEGVPTIQGNGSAAFVPSSRGNNIKSSEPAAIVKSLQRAPYNQISHLITDAHKRPTSLESLRGRRRG
jgi:hypothetical protein